MSDHLSVFVSDFPRSKSFYVQALASVGSSKLIELPGRADVSHGHPNKPPIHIAFRVSSRGGRDKVAPGLRPHYHPNDYGAYVFDPDGHNIEAVCHDEQ